MAAPDLPLDPQPDSPLFRASLSSLDHRTHIVKGACKAALHRATHLRELLLQVQKAEGELLGSLEEMCRHVAGQSVTPAEETSEMDGFRRWKARKRLEEVEQLDTLVTGKLRSLRSDIKGRGAGGGGALARFEDTAKAHYSAMTKHLQPAPNATEAEVAQADARREAQQAEYDYQRYAAHSQALWSAPPYSPALVEFGISVSVWMASALPEAAGGTAGYDEELLAAPAARSDARPERPLLQPTMSHPGPEGRQHAVPFPRARERRITHKSSLPVIPSPGKLANGQLGTEMAVNRRPSTPSAGNLKRQIERKLETLAQCKDELEAGWAARDTTLRELERIAEAKANVGRRSHTPQSGLVPPDQRISRASTDELRTSSRSPAFDTSDVSSTSRGAAEYSKDKKGKGVGSRIKGMISSSNSIVNDLASRASGFKLPSSSSTTSLAQPGARMSLQIGPSGLAAMPEDGGRPKKSARDRHSVQAIQGEQYKSPFADLLSPPQGNMDKPFVAPADEDVDLASPPVSTADRMAAFRDLQTSTGADLAEQEHQREIAGRKKEGLLWSTGHWDDVTGGASSKSADRRDNRKWDKYWVVLASSRIYEYRDGLHGKPEAANETIDLKVGATAREARDTDRRFAFEIVTPAAGKRVYQATSRKEMQSWIYAIGNAVESSLNGTSSVRTFDVSKIQDQRLIGEQGQVGHDKAIGLGFPMPQYQPDVHAGKGSSLPPSLYPQDGDNRLDDNSRAKTPFGVRRTSIRDAFRRQRNSLGHGRRTPDLNGAANISRSPHSLASLAIDDGRIASPLDLPRPSYMDAGSRHSSRSSDDVLASGAPSIAPIESAQSVEVTPATPSSLRPPVTSVGTKQPSWYGPDLDDDIKATVLAMQPPSRTHSRSSADNPSGAQGIPDASQRTPPGQAGPAAGLGDPQPDVAAGEADMAMLRRVAAQPGNQSCVDCGRSLNQENAQRWATIALHQRPTCAFLCIRCAGVHRSMGTHISKVRSPDLDRWTADAILTARAWGNARSNAIWERTREAGTGPADDSAPALKAYIEDKYVHGKWLSEEDRATYMP